MEISRGSIVTASGPGDYSGKPRPFLVVQSDVYNQSHASISLCPITSHLANDPFFRIALHPDVDNGLRATSEVEVDKVQSMRRERIRDIIGKVSNGTMRQIDEALRHWLDL